MTAMESVGDFFRQVRETKGLTLDDVASKTRIHPDFLRALEEGNYAKLPDQVFAKGFVRSYARSLGLDEEDAMRRFGESAGAFYNKQAELDVLRVQQAADERQRLANRKVIFAAAAVAVLALILLLSREQSTVAPRRPPADAAHGGGTVPAPVAPPAATAPQGSAGQAGRLPAARKPGETQPAERSEAPAVPPAEIKPLEGATALPKPALPDKEPLPLEGMGAPLAGLPVEEEPARRGSLTLDLEALELSWVVVQLDGGSPHEALLQPGERIRWTANDRFNVTLGNAGGVRVELNGKPQGPFGPRGKVVRDIVLKK